MPNLTQKVQDDALEEHANAEQYLKKCFLQRLWKF